MKIIVTRHGETEETKSGILQGHLPGELTELGLLQANKLGLKLKDEKIDIIFSSDLKRAWDTANIIHKYTPNSLLNKDHLLREKSFGIFEGKMKKEIGFYNEDKKNIFDSPENGETNQQVYIRARTFFNSIFPKYVDKTALIVCHDDIGKTLISIITGKMINEIRSIGKASISIFEIDKNGDCKTEAYLSYEEYSLN